MPNNKDKKYIELIWADKYKDFIRPEKKAEIERIALPFQITETINEPRIKEAEGSLGKMFSPKAKYPENYPSDWKNKLVWGDNKIVMESLLRGDKSSGVPSLAGKINLIYIDPPFFTGADFSVKVVVGNEEMEKEPSIIEQRAYIDTWSQGIASYLKYIQERLILMRELLTDDGSIYVHCDWHVAHYLKCLMDEIFGYDNFQNEIIWRYGLGGSSPKRWQRKHDVILFYTKSDEWNFNPQMVPATSQRMMGKLKKMDDVWEIPTLNNMAKERVNYDTQKPEELLERIILASSKEGDLILDPMCGSGTTLVVAKRFNRKYIGIDISEEAINITNQRFMALERL